MQKTLPPQPLPGAGEMAGLAALLDLVGPAEAPGLLTQLQLDITEAADSIRKALPGTDWLALRRASHNLIALAGTIGATGLQDLALSLNAKAHAQDAAMLRPLALAIEGETTVLLQRIFAFTTQRQRG